MVIPLLFAVLAATPVEIEGIQVPELATVAGQPLTLAGATDFTYRWVFDVYVASCHAPAGATRSAILDREPLRLSFVYQRAFSADDLAKATRETIVAGLSAADQTAIAEPLRRWNAAYPSVVENDRLTIDRLPGGTVVLAVNAKEWHRETDPRFARALVAIWLGEQAFDEDLRDGMLNRLAK